MKYAAAVLLGLATVKANAVEDFAGTVAAIFQGTNTWTVGPFAITETRDWDFSYGTYYTASQDTQYHYENYGAYIQAYVQEDILIDLTYYQFDIAFTFYPFYLAPVDAWFQWERYLGYNNPNYIFNVNSVSQILYLDTSYTESLYVDTTSLKQFILGNTNNWYPVSGDWALSGTTDSYTSADPYWSVDVLGWLQAQGYIPNSLGQYYGTYNYFTQNFQL